MRWNLNWKSVSNYLFAVAIVVAMLILSYAEVSTLAHFTTTQWPEIAPTNFSTLSLVCPYVLGPPIALNLLLRKSVYRTKIVRVGLCLLICSSVGAVWAIAGAPQSKLSIITAEIPNSNSALRQAFIVTGYLITVFGLTLMISMLQDVMSLSSRIRSRSSDRYDFRKIIAMRRFLFAVLVLSIPALTSFAAEPAPPVPVTKKLQIEFEVPEREWFLFVADGVSKPQRLAIGDEIFQLLRTASVNSVVHFFATPSHRPIATVTIPDTDPSLRMRSKEIKAAVQKLHPWLAKPEDDGSLQIDMPRVSNSIDTVRKTTFPTCVVICGDPIYTGYPHHGGFSMVGALVPTDPTVTASPLSHLSPFYQGVKDFPPHAMVTIFAHDSEWGVDHTHRQQVERFYRLMLQIKGNAHLLRITADVKSAFDLMRPQQLTPVQARQDEFGMRPATVQSALETSENDPITVFLGHPRDKPPVFAVDPPLYDIDELIAKALKSLTHTMITIRWNVDASLLTFTDLDLHLSHPDFEKELSYKNPKTPLGRLLKDVRYGITYAASQDPKDAFGENFEVYVVKNEFLPKLKVWLDVYRAVGPIKVHTMQVGNGKRTDSFFTVPSRIGDEATESDSRTESRAWYPLQLPLQSGTQTLSPKSTTKTQKPSIRQSSTTRPVIIPLKYFALGTFLENSHTLTSRAPAVIEKISDLIDTFPRPVQQGTPIQPEPTLTVLESRAEQVTPVSFEVPTESEPPNQTQRTVLITNSEPTDEYAVTVSLRPWVRNVETTCVAQPVMYCHPR